METAEKKINQDLSAPLSTKVVRGGLWVFGLRITTRGLRFIRTVILARLLAPNDFGLFGIAMLSIATLEAFTQTGFEAALVQKKENVESYLDTAWTVSAVRGTILFSILFLLAPWIAKFFDSPQATMIIRIISISALLSGFKNVGIIFFQKELEFNKQFFYEFSSIIVDLTVAITLAFYLRNVWALIWGGLAASVVRLFMSYLIHPYRPRISLAKKEFQELFCFGKWLLGSGVLVFLVTQGDDLFVGKVLGPAALGLYQMAYLISNMPATEISRTMAQVAFPAYSKLQDDITKLRDAYLKSLHLTALLALPLTSVIFVMAHDLTKLFIGEKWIPMVPAIKILIFAGLIRSIAATTGPILYATGKPRMDTTWQTVRLVILATTIYPLTVRWDILGTSIAVLLSIFVSTFGFCIAVIRITKCSIHNFFKTLIFPALNSLVMTSIIMMLKINLKATGFLPLLLIIAISMIIYFILAKLYDKLFNYEIQQFVKSGFIARQ